MLFRANLCEQDTTVFDEPLYAHHLRVCPELERPYKAAVMAAQDNDGDAVVRDLVMGDHGKPIILAKHMAKQVDGRTSTSTQHVDALLLAVSHTLSIFITVCTAYCQDIYEHLPDVCCTLRCGVLVAAGAHGSRFHDAPRVTRAAHKLPHLWELRLVGAGVCMWS